MKKTSKTSLHPYRVETREERLKRLLSGEVAKHIKTGSRMFTDKNYRDAVRRAKREGRQC